MNVIAQGFPLVNRGDRDENRRVRIRLRGNELPTEGTEMTPSEGSRRPACQCQKRTNVSGIQSSQGSVLVRMIGSDTTITNMTATKPLGAILRASEC